MRGAAHVLAALLVLGVAGCGQPHDDDVRGVAQTFYEAHSAGDGATACRQLAPDTRSELEQSSGKSCDAAVVEEDVPEVAALTDIRVFGTQAEVTWKGETTFLTRFQDGWKVMAAACTPRHAAPYECTLSGG